MEFQRVWARNNSRVLPAHGFGRTIILLLQRGGARLHVYFKEKRIGLPKCSTVGDPVGCTYVASVTITFGGTNRKTIDGFVFCVLFLNWCHLETVSVDVVTARLKAVSHSPHLINKYLTLPLFQFLTSCHRHFDQIRLLRRQQCRLMRRPMCHPPCLPICHQPRRLRCRPVCHLICRLHHRPICRPTLHLHRRLTHHLKVCFFVFMFL